MQKICCLILVICLCVGMTPVWAEETVPEIVEEKTFIDIPEEHEAYTAVMELVKKGVINGRSDTEFCPDEVMKREEFAKVLSAVFALSDSDNSPIFYDVPVGTWYADYVRLVGSSGLMTGISEGRFGVGLELSRQDLAHILKRFLDNENVELILEDVTLYADDDEIADYAKESVTAIRNAGIMPGRTDNMWQPQKTVTRAEMAQIIYNTIEAKDKAFLAKGRWKTPEVYAAAPEPPTDDRLAEAMPKPFDPNTWNRIDIGFEDFEDTDLGVFEMGYSTGTVETTGGYDNNGGCIKVLGGGTAEITYTAPASEIGPGDWLAFTCMVKCKDYEGSGWFRNMITVYDGATGEWKKEGNCEAIRKDTDWIEVSAMVMVPFDLNALTRTESYKIGLRIYPYQTTGGEYWGDNFKLSKILFHPMDTVLMSPAYKGIIKGEDGYGDIALRAYVNEDNGAYDLSKMNFTAQITDDDHNVLMKSESAVVTNQMDIFFSSAKLPMGGDYYLESILTDKETGEVIQKDEWPLHKKPEDFQTFLGYDEHGRITKNGKPTILITAMGGDHYYDMADDMIEAGCFDGISFTGLGWHWAFGDASEEQKKERAAIEKLAENEMGISVGGMHMIENDGWFGQWDSYMTNKDSRDIRKLIEQIVRNYKDMPGMFFYPLHDEKNALQWGHQIGWNRKIVESLDLDHPTYGAIDNPLTNRPGVAAKMTDFLSYDPYPVTGRPDQKIELVYERITDGIRVNPGRPVMLCSQFFWWKTNANYLRIPTETEFRNMIFQALCAGADGIDNYSYRELKNTPGEEGFEAKWTQYTNVLREVKQLEPVLLSLEPSPYYEIRGGGEWLKHTARRYDGKSYLFTVNTAQSGKRASIDLDGVDKIRGMYSGKVYERDSSGFFEVEWDTYETEIFEIEQDDYESSHAELKRFALVDCIMIGAEEENSAFVIDEELNTVNYRAIISQNAKLYINGKEVEETGTLQLEGLSAITVKVVSENGKFETNKTYTIERR